MVLYMTVSYVCCNQVAFLETSEKSFKQLNLLSKAHVAMQARKHPTVPYLMKFALTYES